MHFKRNNANTHSASALFTYFLFLDLTSFGGGYGLFVFSAKYREMNVAFWMSFQVYKQRISRLDC